jgi:hypothetical protein
VTRNGVSENSVASDTSTFQLIVTQDNCSTLTFDDLGLSITFNPGQTSQVQETIALESDAENVTWSKFCGYASLTWDISGADFCINSVTTIQENGSNYYE